MFPEMQNFDQSEFIERYWQKKPCLIRQAFNNFASPVSAEELAGLACEEEVHSRLVIEKHAATPWQLRYGPFGEADFLSLPDSHYSLLVSECEKWIPEFALLLDQFRFIPAWRIDDLMLSYAPVGGSVGAHIDEYDVFLLQVEGQRKWQYTDQRVDHPNLIPDLDLAILQNFAPDQEAILEPGDMLYLPPGIAHHGVALEPCLTCSIGFRAPTATEVLESVAVEIDQQQLGLARYTDPDLETRRDSAEITEKEIERFKSMVLGLVDQPQDLWRDAVGKLLSDSAVITEELQNQRPTRLDQLNRDNWFVNPQSRMLFHSADSEIRFYCDAQLYLVPDSADNRALVELLCSYHELPEEFIEQCKSNPPVANLLLKLIDKHAILAVTDDA